MRGRERVDVHQESWPVSKCQRVLRPLKLKIMAIERALSTSYSVSDGMTSWTDHSTQRRSRFDSNSDSSMSYNPGPSKLRKYGAARKQAAAARVQSSATLCPSADDILISIRASNSPSIGNAYLGVYYAFRAILEKVDSKEKFPSLAARAGITVGRCVHLTGEQFTNNPIDADDWYEACPAHLRGPIVTGHAAQIVISSCTILGPLMPALILSLKHDPVAINLLVSVLENTSFTDSRKCDIQALQNLANQVGAPWVVQAHFTRIFELSYIRHPAFGCLTLPRIAEELNEYSLALYIKAHTTAVKHLRKRRKSEEEADFRILNTLVDLSRRVLLTTDEWTISYFCDMYQCSEADMFLALSIAFNLAALRLKPTSLELIKRLSHLSTLLHECNATGREQYLIDLTQMFSEERIVELTELLVGRSNDLALMLSKTCASQFEGDYLLWATSLETDVVHAQVASDSDKYRFEPLLDSWVTKTPGLQKMKKSRVIDIEDETDDDGTSIDEEGYRADQSRTQLSFVEADCESDDDLISSYISPKSKISSGVCSILSAKRSITKLKSEVLVRRYGRLSSDKASCDTPCGAGKSHTASQDQHLQHPCSPLMKTSSKRQIYTDLSSVDSASLPEHVTRSKRQKLTMHGSPKYTQSSPGPLDSSFRRTSRMPLRELRNLKSSFATRRRAKPRSRNEDDKMMSGQDGSQLPAHPKSESDELNLL